MPFSVDTWRRTQYLALAAPVSIVSVPLALLGGHRAAARLQRALARRYLGLRIAEPASGGAAARTIVHAVLSLPISLVSLALAAYLWSGVVLNLAYPLRPGTMDSYQHSWGGPTLAGAWAVHAAGGLAILWVVPWIVSPPAAWTAHAPASGRLVKRARAVQII